MKPLRLISNSYLKKTKEGIIKKEPFQKEAIESFDVLSHEVLSLKKISFFKLKTIKGIYLHGNPGGGKSLMMSLFVNSLNKYDSSKKIRRVYFHDFMNEIHDKIRLKRLKKNTDPLFSVAMDVAKSTQILCFDELEVRDIADAMILARFFSAVISKKTIIVATSNFAPDELYKHGLQRSLFVPFIELLKNKMNVIEVSNSKDYRVKQTNYSEGFYYYPLRKKSSDKLALLFKKLSKNSKINSTKILSRGRTIAFNKTSDEVLFTDFKAICEEKYSAYDYIKIVLNFKWILIDKVPIMRQENRNEIRRFVMLIDVMYENSINLAIVAEDKPAKLCNSKEYYEVFKRTSSRLEEMRNVSWSNSNLT